MEGVAIFLSFIAVIGLSFLMLYSLAKIFFYLFRVMSDRDNDLRHSFNPFNNIFKTSKLSERSLVERKKLISWMLLFLIASMINLVMIYFID